MISVQFGFYMILFPFQVSMRPVGNVKLIQIYSRSNLWKGIKKNGLFLFPDFKAKECLFLFMGIDTNWIQYQSYKFKQAFTAQTMQY